MVISHYRCPHSMSLFITLVMDGFAVMREKGSNEIL